MVSTQHARAGAVVTSPSVAALATRYEPRAGRRKRGAI